MFMNRSQQRGFTLIELIIFIVAVSVGLAGILLVKDTVVKSSADPMVRKQAMVLAESILEEIVQKEYADPDGVSGETTRATMDDVDDYHGKTEMLFNSASGAGGWPVALDGHLVTIRVEATTLGDPTVTAKKVTVTVSRGRESISLSGYRANY